MIDFKDEISKYRPVMSVDDVEQAIQADEMKDLLDLLQYISNQIDAGKESRERGV